MIPVIIEDLIAKVLDSTKHPEHRQHYVSTLENIVKASNAAIKKFDEDKHFSNTRKKK